MYCSIIPYSRSVDDRLLTYILPPDFAPFVQVGSSVVIPWGNESIIGIVADIHEHASVDMDIKPITAPHCTTPWFSSSELGMIVDLARRLFVRVHTVAQLFLPTGLLSLFEKQHFTSLTPPVSPQVTKVQSEYVIAPDEKTLQDYLQLSLQDKPALVILPEGVSVKTWSQLTPDALVDHHPKSLSTQKRIYLDILSGHSSCVYGTRRTLLKRIGHYSDIYVMYDALTPEIVFGQRRIPLWMMCDMLEQYGYTIHYLTTTPSVRILCDFLQKKKTVHYL